MLHAPHTTWPPVAVAVLIRGALDRRTAGEVAAELGATRNAVRGKARRLGVRLAARPAWTLAMSRRLRGLIAEGATRCEAADELGIGVEKLKKRMRVVGIRFRRGGRPDAARDSRIIGLVERGTDTASKIASVFGVRKNAVAKSVRRLVRAGLLRRVGSGRGSRLRTGKAWNEPDERTKGGGHAGADV